MYELAKLWEDDQFVLSRATRAGATSLLVSTPRAVRLTAGSLARLQRALSLRGDLSSSWAALPCELADYQGRPTLISEDPHVDLLARQLGRPWPGADFLRVAIGLAAALRQLHARAIVHKDIKPANVLANPATGGVWLTGFGIASRLPRERQLPEPPEVIAGTLAYMAPEQTGRMNRSIDSRSDLYAFGVTLYEILAGTLPFAADDPMEWVHCHVARHPAPLQSKARGIPGVVCEIVMKLLAKTAEDRYQTAAGVEHDLRRALDEWETTGRVRAFVPGSHDASERLLIPEKLYGRNAEIEVLLSSLQRVVARGDTQLVLVSGYAGIGKSSVVNELHRVLVSPRGLFAAGKFDQYKRGIPYATLAQAFAMLIRQVLSKSEEEIRTWREELSRELGHNGQLICNWVPELEFVIGKQPPVPELSGKDAQARFRTVVGRFLAVFARADHPLALFLDDLQWLDAATLDLLEHLVGDPEVRHLLIVGAYRDNEVDATHALAGTLEKLRGESDRVREIVLSPLRIEDIAELCGDALRMAPTTVGPLAALVHAKTGGNPFFAIQFITALADERLLAFEAAGGSWRWDVGAIRAKGYTDNVVDLMSTKLHRLPIATRCALRQLACLGNAAHKETLGRVYGLPEDGVHAALADAVIAGLVLRSGDEYSFLHDRVREAAYAMIPDDEHPAEHLRIGTILAAGMSVAELDDNIFEVVNHLNRGAGLLAGQEERVQLAERNRVAGRRAKVSTAHVAARAYVAFGRSLLGPNAWEKTYRLTFELELELADCEFLTGDLEGSEARLETIAARARDLPDRSAVIFVQTILYTAMADRTDRAIQICLDYLRHVGVEWSPHPSREMVQGEYQALIARVGERSLDEVLQLPLLRDPDLTATIDVLLGMLTPAFNSDPDLVCLILCRMANLGLAHGHTDASSLGYAFLAMALTCTFGDYRTGSLFGKLAVDLVEVRGLERYRGRIYHTLGTHVLAWTQPIAAAQASLRRGMQSLQEIGDVTYVGFCYCGLGTILIGGGAPLEAARAEVESGLVLARKVKFEMAIDIFTGHLRFIGALRGELPDPCTLEDGGRRWVGDLTRAWYWLRTMQACVFYGDVPSALQAARAAGPLMSSSAGFFESAEYHYFAALVRVACLEAASSDDRAEHGLEVTSHRRALALLADNCPENFGGRLALVDAEIARTGGRPLDAMEGYERAIRAARDNGLIHDEALAFEVAARFYVARGFETIARTYRAGARSAYLRWGAVGKVRELDRAHDGPLSEAPGPRPSSTIETPSAEMDLATVVRGSEAVTAEIGLDKLVETLMVIALEHAGADRGLLILPRGGALQIEAEAGIADDMGVSVHLRRGMARYPDLPETILHYVSRTQEVVLLPDAQNPSAFSTDAYLRERRSRSVVCVPLVKRAELIGLLYLENSLTPHVFTNARLAVLKLLASQAATSLVNASLAEENASLAEKESLLREVHHRVKNNLQLISSLLSLQASRVTDPVVAELFAESRNRVRAMALVHENLYRAGNFARIPMATHIRTLCAHLSRAYGLQSHNIQLTTSLADVHLEMSRAVSCGLIVNELVSNAIKHAFPDGRPGHVNVDLHAGERSEIVLAVSDDGVGLAEEVDFTCTDSLGLRLVRDLTEQLHGRVAVSGVAGTTFTVTFDPNARGSLPR